MVAGRCAARVWRGPPLSRLRGHALAGGCQALRRLHRPRRRVGPHAPDGASRRELGDAGLVRADLVAQRLAALLHGLALQRATTFVMNADGSTASGTARPSSGASSRAREALAPEAPRDGVPAERAAAVEGGLEAAEDRPDPVEAEGAGRQRHL